MEDFLKLHQRSHFPDPSTSVLATSVDVRTANTLDSMHQQNGGPSTAAIAVADEPSEYEGANLRAKLLAMPPQDAALAGGAMVLLYDLGDSEWVTGHLHCRKAQQAADGSMHFYMMFQREEPAGAAPFALPHAYSLEDLAYLRLVPTRIPLGENERPIGTFGVAQ
jgi:hypothetical protein